MPQPNDLRRTFGKWHRARGFEPSLIAVLLGHTTDKLAQTTYATVEGKELGALVYKIGTRKNDRNKKNDPGSRSWRGQATYPIAWTSFGPLRPDVLRTSIVCASRGDSVNSLES